MADKKQKTEKQVTVKPANLNTTTLPTWCPGCFNFQILAGVKNFLNSKIKSEKDKRDWAIVTGIGCASKIFDYINLPGVNSLHGRVLPTALGIKAGNPNLNVMGFAGDGDAYAEGIEHLIHMARFNPNVKYLVHNNQVFALTVGQPTPMTEKGFVDKTTPMGVKFPPLNVIKIMISSGCGFVARVFADVKQISDILEQANNHRGFSFIEVIQPCIIFHPDADYKKHSYNLQETGHDKSNMKAALEKCDEFDYNQVNDSTKIPLGIFYQNEQPVFEDVTPQLAELKSKKLAWKDIKR
jgi:2-oxoglutarate/2-oxoacid ferredoxin oxidoreductase subunit beta